MGSRWGSAFRVTTFGESHGGGLGCVIDGCPPGIRLDLGRIQAELDRRRPGQSSLTTPRSEADRVEILSGVFDGRTLGSPVAMLVRNQDADSSAYELLKDVYRPSHADFTTEAKYGVRAWAGGGRASARETVARVAAGAVARQVLETIYSSPAVQVIAWVDRVYDVAAAVDPASVASAAVEADRVRCPDPRASAQMVERIESAKNQGDSLGGVIRCVARGVPAGLGEPVFDKLEAELAKAMLSIPAARGFEIGSGFAASGMRGSEHNDAFEPDGGGGVRTRTNHSGGVQGGISNGMPIVFAVAFKPVATIASAQVTVNRRGEATSLEARGRHDPCVLPRAVPIVEAMAWLTLVDHALRWRAQGRSSD